MYKEVNPLAFQIFPTMTPYFYCKTSFLDLGSWKIEFFFNIPKLIIPKLFVTIHRMGIFMVTSDISSKFRSLKIFRFLNNINTPLGTLFPLVNDKKNKK